MSGSSTVAAPHPSQFHRGFFLFLCAVVGPPVGFATQILVGTVAVERPKGLPSLWGALLEPQMLFFTYVLGLIFAIPAALIFIYIEYRFRRTDLGAALLAAIVLPLLVGIGILIRDVVSSGSRLFNPLGVAVFVLTGGVAMTACWLLARLLEVFRERLAEARSAITPILKAAPDMGTRC